MRPILFVLLLVVTASDSSAQIVESVGNRALGMGGAFVAVASDSSATWWNPAGLATGPFADMSLGRTITDLKDAIPARRDRVSGAETARSRRNTAAAARPARTDATLLRPTKRDRRP